MIDKSWFLGKIKFFDVKKGFGFVTELPSEIDYFVHVSKISTIPIQNNDLVAFQLRLSKKKDNTFEANYVTLLSEFKSNDDFLLKKYPEIKYNSISREILSVMPPQLLMHFVEEEVMAIREIANEQDYLYLLDHQAWIYKTFKNYVSNEVIINLIEKRAIEVAATTYKVKLWIDNIVTKEPSIDLVKEYFTNQTDYQEIIFQKLTYSSKISLFENILSQEDLNLHFDSFILFLKLENNVELQKKIAITIFEQFHLDYEYFARNIYELDESSVQECIISIVPPNFALFFLEYALSIFLTISSQVEYEFFLGRSIWLKNSLKNIIDTGVISVIVSQKALEISTDDFIMELWLDEIIISEPCIELIIGCFGKQRENQNRIYQKLSHFKKNELYINYINDNDTNTSLNVLIFFLNIEKDTEIQKKFINKIQNEFKFVILTVQQSFNQYEKIKKILINFDENIIVLFISFFYTISTDYIKLLLWLENLIESEDYDIYHLNFIFLSTENQILYIKKLFFLLSTNARGISYENIQSLINLTYDFPEGKKYQVDFSCNVILTSIESIKSGKFLNEKSIFSILTKQVENDASSLLSLGGFFERCNGRTIPDKTEINGEQGESIISLKTLSKPREVEFCEGVKFGGDGKDRRYKHDCWWCRGGSCFRPNQFAALPTDYKHYTLAGFLTILGIPYDIKEYFDFIGLINKVNVFLKHLECRSCKHILQPAEKNNYGFYRVSYFKCANVLCEKNNERIYLNHCLGAKKTAIKSKCYNLIDSRNTVRCNYSKYNPKDNYEGYGPYICNTCGSCCSQKSLEKKYDELVFRKWAMQPGLSWKVANNVGHLEREEIFCYKCGIEMVNNEKDYTELHSILYSGRNTHNELNFKIRSSNINSKGVFWALVKGDADFFIAAQKLGFKVSGAKGDDPSVKFVSEGNINFLVCQKCKISYNRTKSEYVTLNEGDDKLL